MTNFAKGGSRLAEARRTLLDLISFRPYVPDYHLALALVLRKEGRRDEFYRKLNDVLDLNGPKQIVYLLMAEYHMQNGEKEKALTALGRAAEDGMKIMEAVAHVPDLTSLRTDTEFVKLALGLERFSLRSLEFPQNFRDPFRPSTIWSKVTSNDASVTDSRRPGGSAPQKEEQAKLLVRAKAALKAIERYLNTPQASDTRAMEKYRELQEIMGQRSQITVPRIAREFDAIGRKLVDIETRLEDLKLRYFWEEAEKKIAEMKEAFDATQYKKVEVIHSDVSKIAKDMVKASTSFKPAAKKILQVADHWKRRALIRADFATKKLEILGIVTSQRDDKDANFVILNNKLLSEGDEFGELRVEKIERNRVTFRYQGERIGLVFRRY
jgi:tetratricopeptide (TPR) repeat protein